MKEYWQSIWGRICRMAYEGTDICESIVTEPQEYSDDYELTLDYTWKQYSRKHGTKFPDVVPEFKKLVVPFGLYANLGINPWFKHSFPNCKVEFWS